MSDERPPVDVLFDALGLAAVVRVERERPIDTSIVWLTPRQELQPGDSAFYHREGLRLVAIRTDEVARVPVGTEIDAPEIDGGTSKTWRVDGIDTVELDHVRAFVVEV